MAAILIRPWGVSEALAALAGAVLMVATGCLPPAELVGLLAGQWNVYGFFLGLMVITAFAEQAGVFEALTSWIARRAAPSARRLYAGIFLAGAGVTAFLSNDATALILTPAVYALAVRLRLPVLPFMYGCTFVADGASFLLPFSNPINLFLVDRFRLSLGGFLGHLLLPSLFSIGFNLALFLVVFRKQLGVEYLVSDLPPQKRVSDRFFRSALVVLCATGGAYLLASLLGAPLSVVALGGAVGLGALALRYGVLDVKLLLREISWSLFVFITAMFVVIKAVEDLGITRTLGALLARSAGSSPFLSALLTASLAAFGANLLNNVPMALLMTSGLRQLGPSPHAGLLYAAIVGVDIGPNLTTVGSLATIVWMFMLRKRGVEVTSLAYFKLGVLVVPAVLLAASALIWIGV